MTIDTFWRLIEESRGDGPTTGEAACDAQADRLEAALSRLPPEEIVSFRRHYDACFAAAYRWDLWAVAYLIHGGCSDDAFMDFRAWLIGQGRAYFEAALVDAERAADRVEPDEEAECEALAYAAARAYEGVAGAAMPAPAPDARPPAAPADPAGKPWEEDDLEALYPALWEKYGWDEDAGDA